MADVYCAKQTFSIAHDGISYVVHQGQRVRKGHPLLKVAPMHFEPYHDRCDFEVVEQATAAPNERRKGPGRPKLPRDDKGNIIRDGGDS